MVSLWYSQLQWNWDISVTRKLLRRLFKMKIWLNKLLWVQFFINAFGREGIIYQKIQSFVIKHQITMLQRMHTVESWAILSQLWHACMFANKGQQSHVVSKAAAMLNPPTFQHSYSHADGKKQNKWWNTDEDALTYLWVTRGKILDISSQEGPAAPKTGFKGEGLDNRHPDKHPGS